MFGEKQLPGRTIEMLRKIVLIFFLMASTGFGATHTISSLPYTVNQAAHSGDTWDTLVFDSPHLQSQTDGLLFGTDTHHWVVLLGDDTLTFGIDSTYRPYVYTGARAIGFDYNSDFIVIDGGYYLHRPSNVLDTTMTLTDPDTLNSYAVCIDIGGNSNDIEVKNVRLAEVRGRNGTVCQGGDYNIYIHDSHFINNNFAYDSRCQFRCLCYKRELGTVVELGDYNIKLERNRFESNAHAAVYISVSSGNATLLISEDTLVLDVRNREYLDGSGGTCASSTNAYGIQITGSATATVTGYIENCKFESGDTYGGGRGIMLISVRGLSDDYFIVRNNYMRNHEGYNVEFSPSVYAPCCMKIRQECEYLLVDSNIMVYLVDTGWGEGEAYHYNGEPFVYQIWEDSADALANYHVTIKDNICSTLVVSPVADDSQYEAGGVLFDMCLNPDTSFHFESNYIYSEGNYGISFGHYDGPGLYIDLVNNTIDLNNSKISTQYSFNIGDYRGVYGNRVIDMTYSGNASPLSHTSVFQNSPSSLINEKDIPNYKTINVHVQGLDSIRLSGADIVFLNNYGDTVATGLTDSNGDYSEIFKYNHLFHIQSDSLDFNDLYIVASYDGDTATSLLTVNWNSGDDTLTLSNTAGGYTFTKYEIGHGGTVSGGEPFVGRPRSPLKYRKGYFTYYDVGGSILTGFEWMSFDSSLEDPIVMADQYNHAYQPDRHLSHSLGPNQDTIYIAERRLSSFLKVSRLTLDGSGNISVDSISGSATTYGTDGSFHTGWCFVYGDTIFDFGRGDDVDPTLDFAYNISTDRGLTWHYNSSSPKYVHQSQSGTSNWNRDGGIDYDGGPSMIPLIEADTMAWYNWDWNDTVYVRDGDFIFDDRPDDYSLSRFFSYNVLDDTIQYVAVLNSEATTLDTILVATKTKNQTTWTETAFPLDTNYYGTQCVYLAVIDSIDILVMFYTQRRTADTAGLYMRYVGTDGVWTNEVMIDSFVTVKGTEEYIIAGLQKTPVELGTSAFCVYPSYDGTNYTVELLKLTINPETVTEPSTPITIVNEKKGLGAVITGGRF